MHNSIKTLLLIMGLITGAGTPAHAEDHFRLATLEWPPYIGPQLHQEGYVAELVRQAFEAGGGSAEHEYLPWARALLQTQKGQYVGIYPEYYDASREVNFVFSDPFPGGPVGLFRRRGSDISYGFDPNINQDQALRSLEHYYFGVVRDYINTKSFDNADYLIKFESPSDASNLMMLQKGRVDLIFIDQLVADHLIRTRFPELDGRLELMPPALEYKNLYIAFARNHPQHQQALKTFNLGLKRLKQAGKVTELLNEFNIPHPE